MKLIVLSWLSIFLFWGQIVFAADPYIYSHKQQGAINGADVVAYYSLKEGKKSVKGDKNISYEYQGAIWYFSTAENRDLFSKEPEKYLPQYGGYCAFAASHGFTKSIKPDYWHIVDGKLYLNYNFFADRKWNKDRGAAIERADKNWPKLLRACEAHNNCGE